MDKIRGFEILPEFAEAAEKITTDLGIQDFIPQRATKGSSGYDIRAIEDVVIQPGEVKLVGTGLTAYMQEDEELQLRGRSGLAKKNITLANCIGTIDSDYYGKHIMFMIYNRSNEPFTIKAGDRVGQGIFSKYLITDSDRPEPDTRIGGFGSTGTK